LGFISDAFVSPDVKNFFTPLDSYNSSAPIEDYEDIFEGLRQIFIFGGTTYAVPMRAGGNLLYYNKEYIRQTGLSITKAADMTMEEIIELMKKGSFTKPNGDKVYGFAKQGEKTEIGRTAGYFLRAKDGDYYTPDYKITVQDPRVIWAVNVLKDLYNAGALPPNFTSIENPDAVQLFKSGRGTFYSGGPGYLKRLTTGDDAMPEDNIGFMNFPASKDYKGKYPVAAPIATFAWGMVIPKGAQHKDLSWKFFRAVLSKEAILNGSLSGNSPVRASTFEEPRYMEKTPYLEEQLAMFAAGRSIFPGFDNYAEFRDILGEEMQLVVLGKKSAEQAMADVEKKATDLMPK
jgi:multiple sugar transport system substrate-binding protein